MSQLSRDEDAAKVGHAALGAWEFPVRHDRYVRGIKGSNTKRGMVTAGFVV